MVQGKSVRFELIDADPTSVASLSIFDNTGAAVIPTANQVLYMQSVIFTAAGTVELTLFDDVDGGGTAGAGDRLAVVALTAAIIHTHTVTFSGSGMMCGPGRIPKVIGTAAVATRITGNGIVANL